MYNFTENTIGRAPIRIYSDNVVFLSLYIYTYTCTHLPQRINGIQAESRINKREMINQSPYALTSPPRGAPEHHDDLLIR